MHHFTSRPLITRIICSRMRTSARPQAVSMTDKARPYSHVVMKSVITLFTVSTGELPVSASQDPSPVPASDTVEPYVSFHHPTFYSDFFRTALREPLNTMMMAAGVHKGKLPVGAFFTAPNSWSVRYSTVRRLVNLRNSARLAHDPVDISAASESPLVERYPRFTRLLLRWLVPSDLSKGLLAALRNSEIAVGSCLRR